MRTVDRSRLGALMQQETQRFISTRPKSAAHADTTGALVGGVPMPWMRRWPGPFPLVLDAASGARFTDIDGH
ncbi:MAG: aspartate aminotransferase family protein, partial [Acidimicrobiia bacterium]|nr:aspartate aminotransferase family protein [Acidimicrobiia bacterium]